MRKANPPFRGEHVGSLLRPDTVRAARAQVEAGTLGPAGLKAVEDEAIIDLIKKQEAVGLNDITDGELRRTTWHYDFLEGFDGVEAYDGGGFQFHGTIAKIKSLRVIKKLGAFDGHPMIDHFRFLRAHTTRTPKMTIPAPSALHFRFGRKVVSEEIYPDLAEFYSDLGKVYNKAVKGFVDAGCRFLQLDEVHLAYLCDPEQRKALAERGEDVDNLPRTYANLINAAVEGIPDDVTIGMHLCRGNFRSTFVATGGYEPVAEMLFNNINVDAYFMEFDSERAGGFEPLRFVPKNKTVVLGLITSKTGELESKDDVKRRIDEATKFIPFEQLCLSPQCGFASTEAGNSITEQQQWDKLRLVVEIAQEVWGTSG